MHSRPGSVVLASFLAGAAAADSAAAVPPPAEYGLRGLRRVEVVFVNVGRGIVGGIVAAEDARPPGPPPEDLTRQPLSRIEACRQVAPTLRRAGLEVVDSCRGEDAACGRLLLTAETAAIPGVADRALLVGIELRQPARLVRNEAVVLSAPTTWSEHRVGAVAAGHSAAVTACRSLRDLATWLASQWTVANE